MAIHQEQIQELQGFDKEIEESALGMIFDNLQRYQYQYPQKSTVRELVSNALDAVREKQNAVAILKGKAKVEDYYLHREEALYKDSNFDPSYYDLNWLWHEDTQKWNTLTQTRDTVYVTYVDGGDRDKDKLIIEDFGVGLGQKRIEGYFKLGYSTKRNTKTALGKFGIGAKAALSAAPYYYMTTRYNGREYRFQIFSSKIVSIVPQFDLDTGKSNGVHMFSNGAIVYFRETKLPNGTTIELEAKKHHKALYIDAVKSQLLYFDNVEFRVRNTGGGLDVIPIKATILYEDDHIVLSDNNQYSKPHLLINKVNYGYVDFKELELEDKLGNIGIKVAAEDVSVNPSRESVMWDDMTRETVVKRFNKVVDIAGHMISEQLKVEDFIEWIKSCAEITARYANSNSIVGRLARIVDLSRVRPRYCKDESLKFDQYLIRMMEMRLTTLTTLRQGSTIKYSISRSPASITHIAEGRPIVVMNGRASFAKDKYLLEQVYPDGFISFRLRYTKVSQDEDMEPDEDHSVTTNAQLEIARDMDISVDELKERIKKVEEHIIQSAHIVPYDSVVVPENFDAGEEVTEEQAEEEVRQAKLSAAERRKLTGSIPIHTPRVLYAEPSVYSYAQGKNDIKLYEWQKMEIPVVDIDQWDEDEVFFATDKVIDKDANGKDVLESSLLHLAAMITRPYDDKLKHNDDDSLPWQYGVRPYDQERCTHFFDKENKKVKLIKIAQDRRRYFTDFKPIQRFFLDIKNKTLTMSNALIRWNTARVMYEHFTKLRFLENYGVFHPSHHAAYHELKQYVEKYYRPIDGMAKSNNYYGLSDQNYKDLINHCDKVMKLQLMAREYKDKPELIAKAVEEMFNPQQEVVDGCAIDIALYDKLMELIEYAEPVHTLLNEVGPLLEDGTNIPENLEREIREYLDYKQVK